MTQLSKALITEITEQLVELNARIERQLSDLTDKETGSVFPNYGEGEDESAEEVATYDTNLQLIDSLKSDLRDTKEALARIENGSYGICKYCKEPIDEQRLRARPTSSSCVACKKALTQVV